MKQQNKKMGQALQWITLAVLWRRKGTSMLLAAVAALGVFASAALQNLTVRQEAAMADMVRNTQIHCVVTNPQGSNSDNLQMFSAFVDMLTGKRHERGCYLDEYVKNVRAKASFSLSQPQGMTLRRILSFDSDSALTAVAGVRISLTAGWTEAAFQTNSRVCIIPSGLETQIGADGQTYITIIMNDMPIKLQVIGTVFGSAGNVIWCPFYLQQQEGISEAFRVESCSFDISDNARLEECKTAIYETFIVPGLSHVSDGLSYGVFIPDETYQSTLAELRSNLSILRLLLPILIVLCGCMGFLAAYLTTRGRVREFAVMRCLGLKRNNIFGQVFKEQAILAIMGATAGGIAGFLLEGSYSGEAIAKAGLILVIFLGGAAAASWNVTRVNVMKLMKVEE